MAQAVRRIQPTSQLLYLLSRRGGVKPLKPVCCSQLPTRDASSCFKARDDKSDNDNSKHGGNERAYPFTRVPLMSLGCLSLAVVYWKYNKLSLTGTMNPINELVLSFFNIALCDSSGREGTSRSKQFNFIAEAVQMAAPAVVYIEIQKTGVVDTIFGQMVHPSVISAGSGFIIDDEGHVLTNYHVVSNTNEVTVKLSNGNTIKGTVVFCDPETDLALIKLQLKIDKKVPGHLPFGRSKDVRLGEWVIALGSPLSLSNTITAGIVSCVHRHSHEMGLDGYCDMEYIQTDAMVTRGNSGGPLVNLDGEVIGINTMTAGPGISFAIPIDRVEEFMQKAAKASKQKTDNKRYEIGVSLLTVTPNILYQLQSRINLPSDITNGVLIAEVWSGSPAEQAGLVKFDLIVKINGYNVKNSKQIHMTVQKGQAMELAIIRNGRQKLIFVNPVALK